VLQLDPKDELDDDAEPIRGAPMLANGTPLPTIDARGTALVTLAVLAVLFALQVAAKFVIPMVVSVLVAYALDPLVTTLEKRHVPRFLGTLLILSMLLGVSVYCLYALRGQAQSILTEVPRTPRNMRAPSPETALRSAWSWSSPVRCSRTSSWPVVSRCSASWVKPRWWCS
jgi:predicted PurR-regulated permease PerM